MTKPSVDINTIPYDAPLSIKEPGLIWLHTKSRTGADGKKYTIPDADLKGKWVLISGGNNGIGREASLRMASWGANIVLACRDPPPHEKHPETVVVECQEAAKKAGHVDSIFEWWTVNYADLESVEKLAQRWLKSERPLDFLCNNAGMGSLPSNDVFLTPQKFEILHQVNFLAHVLLTLRLLPSLAKAKEPRILCTTSSFHYLGTFDLTNFNGEKGIGGVAGTSFYKNNKLWFQIWLTEMQRRLIQHDEYKHITINGVHPGYVNSGIWQMNDKTTWFHPLLTGIATFAAYMMGINEEQGSLAITNGVSAPTAGPDREVQGVGNEKGEGGGRYFSRTYEEIPMPHTRDPDCRQRVWRKVNEELKLQEKGLLDVLGLDYVEGPWDLKFNQNRTLSKL